MNNRGLIGTVVVVGVLLVVGFFWFVGESESEGVGEELFCEVDDDCVKVQTGCCPCNMGGEDKCVNQDLEDGHLASLENCSELTICASVFNCEIASCGCVEGVCVGR